MVVEQAALSQGQPVIAARGPRSDLMATLSSREIPDSRWLAYDVPLERFMKLIIQRFAGSALSVVLVASSGVLLLACGGSEPPPPAVVTPDGTQVPLPHDDGEIEEGESEVSVENPDGSESKVEVEVDNDD
jgi:hypothetical protein